MATIKCKSCGRAYNYRSSELCPKCGAFNRPPRRMRVGFNADGGVELQTEKEFVREAQRFDARDDVCAEGQARKVRNSDTLISSETLDQLGNQLNKWGNRVEKWWTENSQKSTPLAKDSPLRDRKKGKSSGSKAVAIVAAVSILVSLLGTIMESCESDLIHAVPEPDVSISVEQVAPTEVYWSEEHYQRILENWSVSQEVGLTEVFELYGNKYWIGDWQLTGGGNGDNVMIVAVNGGEFPVERLNDCFLLWVDWDGTEWTYVPEKFQNGALIFRYLHTTTVPEGTLCWLVFNDFDDNDIWMGTTAVSLVGRDAYLGGDAQDSSSTEVVTWSEEDCKNMLSLYGVTEVVNMGTTFDWEDIKLWVDGWAKDGMDNSTMILSLNSNQPLSATALERCFLVWAPDPNMSWTYYPESYQDGTLTFTDLYDPLHEGIKLWLVCEDYDAEDNRIGATAVILN